MIRGQLIELVLRNVYGGQPTDDASMTRSLVNLYISQGLGLAVKQNYKEAVQLEGVGYVNNGFYATFKGIAVTQNENNLWKISLPKMPLAIGTSNGVSNLIFKSSDGSRSLDCIPLSMNQTSYATTMKAIPNRLLYYTEGDSAYVLSTILLSQFTATVTIVSGEGSDDSVIPDDYVPTIMSYVVPMLTSERKNPKDVANDGTDTA